MTRRKNLGHALADLLKEYGAVDPEEQVVEISGDAHRLDVTTCWQHEDPRLGTVFRTHEVDPRLELANYDEPTPIHDETKAAVGRALLEDYVPVPQDQGPMSYEEIVELQGRLNDSLYKLVVPPDLEAYARRHFVGQVVTSEYLPKGMTAMLVKPGLLTEVPAPSFRIVPDPLPKADVFNFGAYYDSPAVAPED